MSVWHQQSSSCSCSRVRFLQPSMASQKLSCSTTSGQHDRRSLHNEITADQWSVSLAICQYPSVSEPARSPVARQNALLQSHELAFQSNSCFVSLRCLLDWLQVCPPVHYTVGLCAEVNTICRVPTAHPKHATAKHVVERLISKQVVSLLHDARGSTATVTISRQSRSHRDGWQGHGWAAVCMDFNATALHGHFLQHKRYERLQPLIHILIRLRRAQMNGKLASFWKQFLAAFCLSFYNLFHVLTIVKPMVMPASAMHDLIVHHAWAHRASGILRPKLGRLSGLQSTQQRGVSWLFCNLNQPPQSAALQAFIRLHTRARYLKLWLRPAAVSA